MELIEEIKKNWRSDIYNNFQSIDGLEKRFSAWTIRTSDGYGVAIPYNGEDVREDFANAAIYCDNILIDGGRKKVLVLASKSNGIDPAFTNLCFDFINPGENGEQRIELIRSPVGWWKNWKELLGNVSVEERVYDVIGELAVLKYYAKKGYNPVWNGPKQSSYDIETEAFFAEVKSSINRTRKEITINSIYQLSNLHKKLYLVFCVFELTEQNGTSIDSLVEDLKDLGYNVTPINADLEKKGFGIGKSARKKKFLLHSMTQYVVDDNFPKITERSFSGGVLPEGIIDISYVVDLSGVAGINLSE